MRLPTISSALVCSAAIAIDLAAALPNAAPDAPNAPSIASLFPRASSGHGFVSVRVSSATHSPSSSKLRRRDAGDWARLIRLARRASGNGDDVVDTDLANREYYYTTTVGLGTPPQSVTVVLDTGSSELWVNPDCSSAPTSDEQAECNSAGKYTPSDSTTPPVGPFGNASISFGDPTDPSTQSDVSIEYYADVLTLQGDGERPSVSNQTFGVVTASSGLWTGILGLGPDPQEGFAPGRPYSFVLNTLAAQGIIASRVFSLDLRHEDEKEGALVYGGYDKNRFTGNLVSRPFVRGPDNEYRLAVSLTAVAVVNGGRTTNLTVSSAPVLLDSGTTLSRLSADTVSQIASALDAISDSSGSGYYAARCSLRNSRSNTVDFVFGSARVSVALSDFVLDVQANRRGEYCYVGAVATTGLQILGDSVLRAGYFVFDWDNQQVHIGQAASCGDGEDMVAASNGSNSVPSEPGNCAWGEDTGSNTSSSDGDGGDSAANGRMSRSGALLAMVVSVVGLVWLV